MAKLSSASNFSTVSKWEELRRFASAFAQDVFNQVNGHLTFNDNIQGKFINVVFPAASNVAVTTKHGLGYIPNGYFVVNIGGPNTVYVLPGGMTTTDVTFYCNGGTLNAKIFIF